MRPLPLKPAPCRERRQERRKTPVSSEASLSTAALPCSLYVDWRQSCRKRWAAASRRQATPTPVFSLSGMRCLQGHVVAPAGDNDRTTARRVTTISRCAIILAAAAATVRRRRTPPDARLMPRTISRAQLPSRSVVGDDRAGPVEVIVQTDADKLLAEGSGGIEHDGRNGG